MAELKTQNRIICCVLWCG